MLLKAAPYVVELGLFVPLHAGRGSRQRLENPEYFGVEKAYWTTWYLEDRQTLVRRPAGLRLIAKLSASSLESAEDQALEVAARFQAATTFYAGGPSNHPRLLRVARVDLSESICEQWDYYYDSEYPPSIRLDAADLREFLRLLATTNPDVGESLERAMTWYAASVGQQSVLDAYLSAWVGLESIESQLAEVFHPSGPKVHCGACMNVAGRPRDRGKAALTHLFKVAVPVAVAAKPFAQFERLRDEIAHGLRPSSDLRRQARPVLPDLQLALATGILMGRNGVEKMPRYGWQAALPRDYQPRPDARAHTLPAAPLPALRPYQGDWIEIDRKFENQKATVDPEGVYQQNADIRLTLRMNARNSERVEPQRRYEQFDRRGRQFSLVDKTSSTSVDLKPAEWRTWTPTPDWKRVIASRTNPSLPSSQ